MNTYDEHLMEKAIGLLLEKPRTVDELSAEVGRHQRTIKRWLQEMRERGYRVVRDGVGAASPYCIVDLDDEDAIEDALPPPLEKEPQLGRHHQDRRSDD